MTTPDSDIPEAVRAMVQRTTRRIAARTEPDDRGNDGSHATSEIVRPARRTRSSKVLVAAACAALVAAIAIGANRGSTTETVEVAGSPVVSPQPPTSAPATSGTTTGSELDYYDRSISSIQGPIIFPAMQPPQIEWVWLSAGNESSGPMEEDLMVEHGDSGVRICAPEACKLGYGKLMRTFDIDGETFKMFHVPTKNSPTDEIAPLAPEVAAYWKTVTFTSNRPTWLVASMEPGYLPPGD